MSEPDAKRAKTSSSSSSGGGGGGSSADATLPSPASRATTTSWTFDEPCAEMVTNEAHPSSLSVVSTTTTESADVDASDLVVLGLFAAANDDDEEGAGKKKDSETKSDEKKTPPALRGVAEALDGTFGGALSESLIEIHESFKGGAEVGSKSPVLRIVSSGDGEDATKKSKKFAFLGLGKSSDDDAAKEKPNRSTAHAGGVGLKVGASVAELCSDVKSIESCAVVLPVRIAIEGSGIRAFFRDVAASFYNGLYSDDRYRTGSNVKRKAERLKKVTIVLEGDSGAVGAADATAAIEEGKSVAGGQRLARDVVNAPHNVLNSLSMADVARRVASDSPDGCIACTILEKDDCERRGMGAYLGVARGSETPPKFIHLVYTPKEGEVKKKVGIVGKGVCFDTGGYNIKTAMMELMKFDCGGAAAVLGAARTIGEIQPKGVEAHFIIAACENMINEKAYVPSDVLTASNGKTIEVANTDAEGRLTMADALVYADKEVQCESIVELSTLTGACMIALGKSVCGLWTASDDLASDLDEASRSTGEKCWRMPLEKSYDEHLESHVADLKNQGLRWGGAITAALFLRNFVDGDKPFAHLDIAGPVWKEKVGATGFGARLVTEWIKMMGER